VVMHRIENYPSINRHNDCHPRSKRRCDGGMIIFGTGGSAPQASRGLERGVNNGEQASRVC